MQASYWQCTCKNMLRHTIVSAHDYTHISSEPDIHPDIQPAEL